MNLLEDMMTLNLQLTNLDIQFGMGVREYVQLLWLLFPYSSHGNTKMIGVCGNSLKPYTDIGCLRKAQEL